MITRNYQNVLFRFRNSEALESAFAFLRFFPPSFLFLFCLNQCTEKTFRNLRDVLYQGVPKIEYKRVLIKVISNYSLFSSSQKWLLRMNE